ncbi:MULTISPECIES: phosphate ABC transporter substrate-binding protein [Flavobacteriaceae]|uniref:Phosphate ABC transporter substrate-binding protein n=1 Tax=Maribacter cobaltidurans TaxID=1178778 RepID=A0A223VB58_9FLAO|nr:MULTISPECIES: phosphate ABC transporter substrate-binding protein [Flavobacteriaceae]ASV32099.1 hypothetical protein CJ263_18790 [Maribacter cobaltidurans]ASV32261.1 hypothetical protein CJ263_19655 [Maribacter cobaltidurans]MCK0193015.1 phosphate ABC transporter substrate-binding protein [Arenibacter sp. F20364]
MKYTKRFERAFGLTPEGHIDFPKKISNVRLSRIDNYLKMGGCCYCFPHGIETTNSKYSKRTRNWKKHRRNQYKG